MKFPHSVPYKRTANWWSSGGDWYQISTWLNDIVGQGKWDYMDQSFWFPTASDKLMFKLRWV